MEIKVIKKSEELNPTVGNLRKGTMVQYQGHAYIKVGKNVGSGISLNWPAHNSILLNIRQGTLRAIEGDIQVTILHPLCELRVCKATERETIGKYTKC